MMSAWGSDGRVVYRDSIPTHLIYDDEQQTAHPQCAGGGAASPISPDDAPAPSPIHGSSLEKLGESSKAAAPIFSVEDRLQLIADGE